MESVISENKIKIYSSYKHSGEDWIGDIPEHWEISRLGSILTAVSTKNRTELPLLSITREKGVIVRDIENDEDNHNFIPDDLSNYKFLPKGYFGMNKMKAWQGSYGISAQDGIVSPAYFIFKLRDDLDSRFFHLAIRSKLYVEYFGSASDGVRIGQWDLSKPRMKNIPFLIPPLHEQTAIATFLDNKTALIDQAIEIKQKQIEFLKERKQILIQKAVTRGLNPNVKMKDSGVEWIGEIPEHWKVAAIKYFLDIPICDGPHTTPEILDEGIPFISAESIKNGEIDFSKKRGFISHKDHLLFCKKYKPKYEDVYMVKSGATTGNVAIVRTENEFSIWSPLAVFRANKNILSPHYLYYALQVPYFRKGVELKWSFGTQQNIGMGVLSNLPFVIPPLNEQNAIIDFIAKVHKPVENSILIKEQEIQKLFEYKSTLINSAVTGKIKVC